MELRKYTDEFEVAFREDWPYLQQQLGIFTKPVGFWFSVLGSYDWKTWCLENDMFVDRLVNEQRVVLKKDANILYLNNYEEMEAFQKQYGEKLLGRYDLPNDVAIDWNHVARNYDGIIIPNYSFSARWDMNWFYNWDCTSGCVWNGSAIESVTRVSYDHADIREKYKSIEELV